MNSLEWRVKKLESRILGQLSSEVYLERALARTEAREPLLQQLASIAEHYKSFVETPGNNYSKFLELYNRYKDLATELEGASDASESSKAELVLAYEDELVNYLKSTKLLAEKADRVLDISKWPDLSGFQDRIDKLQRITREQHLKSNVIDQKTEDLIELYNEIIGKFKSNIAIWNQRLEAYENEEKAPDDC